MFLKTERSRARFKRLLMKDLVGYSFMLPLILGMAIFNIYPIIQSMQLSFYNYNMMNVSEFIGVQNFVKIFTIDGDAIFHSFGVTFLNAVIGVPLGLVLSYMLAVLLNAKIKGISGFRVLVYFPVVIPAIAGALLWTNIFDPNYGLMNQIFETLGLPRLKWLQSADTALFTMIFMGLWGLGGGMVLWLAALKNIPVSLYEAAKVDGANPFVVFFKITLPLSTPMIFYNLVTSIIGSLQAFGSFLMTDTGRGPENSLDFICVRIYFEAFKSYNMGYACALAWVLFVIIALLTACIFKSSGWVQFGEDM